MNWQIKRSGCCTQQGGGPSSVLARAFLPSPSRLLAFGPFIHVQERFGQWYSDCRSLCCLYTMSLASGGNYMSQKFLWGHRWKQWGQALSLWFPFSLMTFFFSSLCHFHHFILICNCRISPSSQEAINPCSEMNGTGNQRKKKKISIFCLQVCDVLQTFSVYNLNFCPSGSRIFIDQNYLMGWLWIC